MVRAHTRSRIARTLLLAVMATTPLPRAASADPVPPEPTEEPRGPLSLSAACAAALARSPALAGYSWELRAGEARVLQAGRRPNPTLDVTVEDVLGTERFRGGREAQTTLQLSQVIELGGKRGARRDVAAAARDLAASDYEVRRVDVLAETTELFLEVLAAQHEVDLARETARLGETALEAVRRRIRAGSASSLEEAKASIALARYRIEAEHAEHELATARRRLAATWGSTEPAFTIVSGDLFELHAPIPSFDDLARRVTKSPEIRRWASAGRLRTAELALARARRTPDVTAGVGVRRFEGPDAEAFVGHLAIPLPIFDRNRDAVAEAQAHQARTAAETREAEVRLTTALFGLYQELRHAETALESLHATVVPQAESALALSERGLREARLSYLELLDAQRTLVAVRRERIDTGRRYQQFVLSIERLIGQPLHDPSP